MPANFSRSDKPQSRQGGGLVPGNLLEGELCVWWGGGINGHFFSLPKARMVN